MSADIGELIRTKREQLHMTQAQLAEKMGMKETGSISTYERGTAKLNTDKLIALSDALNVPVSYFFGESSERSSDEEKQLLAAFRLLDKDTRKKALDIIKILYA